MCRWRLNRTEIIEKLPIDFQKLGADSAEQMLAASVRDTMFETDGVVGHGRGNQVKLRHFHAGRDHDLSILIPAVYRLRLSVGNCIEISA